MEPVTIPTYLDAPKRLLFWSVDQVIPFSFCFAMGVMFGRLTLGIVLGVAFSWAVEKYRGARADGLMLHMAYWYGLAPLQGRSWINPFIRRILAA